MPMNHLPNLIAITLVSTCAYTSPHQALGEDVTPQTASAGESESATDSLSLLDRLPNLVNKPYTVRVYWENDGSLFDPGDSYDRHYTNGFAITLDHQPDWAQDLFETMPFSQAFAAPKEDKDDTRQAAAGFVLGQLMFTPRSLGTAAPIPTDQPYAGYLYGGAYFQRQGEHRDWENTEVFDHFQLDMGVVGQSALAADIQTWVHANVAGDGPKGWDNQLEDEFAIQFYYKRKWRHDIDISQLPLIGGLEAQMIPQVGLALGSVYRHGEAAVTGRIGHNLPDDFGPGRINDLQSATGSSGFNQNNLSEGDWAWYTWLRLGGRAVEWNTFLDGSNTRNPSPHVESETFVGELQVGAAISYDTGPYSFSFSWGVTFLTDEFDAAGDEGTDSYGTWNLSFTKWF